MKSFGKILVVVAVLSLSISSLNMFAGDPARKLGRGICNVGVGALEIPIKIYDVNQAEGGLAALTYGVLKGFGYFIAREVVGVVDIATFPVPLPGAVDEPREVGWGYGPLMTPEWVVGPEHDIFNIIYQDHPLN